jgi:hypothetical protein
MNPLLKTFAMAVAVAAALISGSADARITTASYCERQLDQCLRRSRIPEPCYWQYEQCVRQGFYAPVVKTPSGWLPSEKRL